MFRDHEMTKHTTTKKTQHPITTLRFFYILLEFLREFIWTSKIFHDIVKLVETCIIWSYEFTEV